jgi:hypothetical protein
MQSTAITTFIAQWNIFDKSFPEIAPDFGSDARRFEPGISSILTGRNNAAAGPKDKQDGIIIFFRDPKTLTDPCSPGLSRVIPV